MSKKHLNESVGQRLLAISTSIRVSLHGCSSLDNAAGAYCPE